MMISGILMLLLSFSAFARGHAPDSAEEKHLLTSVVTKKPPSVIACRSLSVLEFAFHSLGVDIDGATVVEKVNSRYQKAACILVSQEDCMLRAVVKQSRSGSIRVMYIRIHVQNLGDYFAWMIDE